jgi:hypothetical protein
VIGARMLPTGWLSSPLPLKARGPLGWVEICWVKLGGVGAGLDWVFSTGL